MTDNTAGRSLAEWQEFARRDDCLDRMVPSDLRQLIGRIEAAQVDERDRCMRIVSAARNGDIDSDMRTLLHFMETGDSMAYDDTTHEYVHDDDAADRATLRALAGQGETP